MKKKLLLLLALVAIASSGLLGCAPQRVTWQYDDMRAKIAKHEAQTKYAQEFSRTNTDPTIIAIVEGLNFTWRPEKGQIELGYRPDGTVVWRPLPEAP